MGFSGPTNVLDLKNTMKSAADDGYGYNGKLDSIRERYKCMPHAYLDNAASPLILSSIPYKAADLLSSTALVNPHSQGALGTGTSVLVNEVRAQVLELLNADASEFEVVFCQNATAAAKLVGEAISSSHYVYSTDSHTSLVGLRMLANSYGTFSDSKKLDSIEPGTVVSWPLQSNFDGTRYPGEPWSKIVHEKGGLVLLDIASYASTEMPDLNEIRPDFAVLSFYKIFGYPDLGALIVRKSPQVLEFLSHKRYFGGGTVASLAPTEDWVARPKEPVATWLEDGTLPVHSILALKAAMSEFKSIYGPDLAQISLHTKAVAKYCRRRLETVKACKIFGNEQRSPIVTFQLETIGHNEFNQAASLADIHVRAGTLCNIGAFIQNSNMTDADVISNYQSLGKKCNDEISFIKNEPTGVIRASFGPYSSYEDVDALVDLVCQLTQHCSGDLQQETHEEDVDRPVVERLYVYPIKSCAALRVHSSILSESGLEFDRAFCLVDITSKKVLSLKKYRSMAFIKPDIEHEHLIVNYEPVEGESATLRVPLSPDAWSSAHIHEKMVINLESSIVEFFSQAVGIPCTLAKMITESHNRDVNAADLAVRESSTFANSSPLLVITTASVAALELNDALVFRPNIVLQTPIPWIEDEWDHLLLGNKDARIELQGKCRRCNMVSVTQSGEIDSFPYMQLCKYRKQAGKIYFGQHASVRSSEAENAIKEGDILTAV